MALLPARRRLAALFRAGGARAYVSHHQREPPGEGAPRPVQEGVGEEAGAEGGLKILRVLESRREGAPEGREAWEQEIQKRVHTAREEDVSSLASIITSPPPPASPEEVRARRDAAWLAVEERGGQVGGLLRGFFRDHVRAMDSFELEEFEAVLRLDAVQLGQALVGGSARHGGGLGDAPPGAVFRTLVQYCRYHSGEGHGPGMEYR